MMVMVMIMGMVMVMVFQGLVSYVQTVGRKRGVQMA